MPAAEAAGDTGRKSCRKLRRQVAYAEKLPRCLPTMRPTRAPVPQRPGHRELPRSDPTAKATPGEGRDLVLWLTQTIKPRRSPRTRSKSTSGTVNLLTRKR